MSKERKVGDIQAGSADLLCIRDSPHLTLCVLFLPRTFADDGGCVALLHEVSVLAVFVSSSVHVPTAVSYQ